MNPAVILAVDDNPDNLFILREMMSEYLPDCHVLEASNAHRGLRHAVETAVDIALIDVQMPDMDGIEMCARLKVDPATADIPVLLLTAHKSDPALKARGLGAGADDFVTKPLDNIELVARIKVLLRTKTAEDNLRRQKQRFEAQLEERTRALAESEKRYRQLVEDLPVGVFRTTLGEDGRLLMANTAIANMFGYKSSAEVLTMPAAASYQDQSQRLRLMNLLRQNEALKGLELNLKRRDGSPLISSMTAHLVRDQDGAPLYIDGILEDITERRNLEKQFQQSQKMEAIGTLAGGIAHDFNNILFPIIGYVEMMLDETPADSDDHYRLNEALNAAKRARELVKQILVFSRRGQQELKPLQIQLILKEALKLVRSSLPSTIEIRRQLNESCGMVRADPTQVHQIVMNLMTNAYHAMQSEGGILTVTLEQIELQPGEIIDPNMVPGCYANLTISDTGGGIPASVIEKIFDPYFTTKAKGKGTGLGLAVVHGIVQSYGGGITVSSEVDQGTTIAVYLPVVEDGLSADETIVVESTPGGSEHILVVDDESPIVKMLDGTLKRLGYTVTSCTDSRAALKLFRSEPERFDLVITDMTMPRMTGAQLAKALLDIAPQLPIIMCTGFSEQFDREMASLTGIREYLTKPLLKLDIAKAIRRALAGELIDNSEQNPPTSNTPE